MATNKPYYRYHCDDLNMDIYVTDIIDQPDYGNYSGSFIPLTKAFNIPIVDKFRTEIDTAFANRVDWSSGVIRLGRIKNGNTLTNEYLMITISTNVNTGRVVYTKGYGNGITYTRSVIGDTSYADLDADGEMRKQINICIRRGRSSYNFEGMPNYDGTTDIELFTGPIQGMAGTWTEPGGVYPYGRMTYSFATWTSTQAIPNSIPCADNNAQSRSEQSEIIGQAYGTNHFEYSSGTNTLIVVAYDGSYDPNPPDPSDEDPNAVGPGYPSGPGGGGGDHDPDSDPIDVPALPTIGVQSLGGVTMYKLTSAEIGVFGRELVSKDVWDAVKLYFQNPMDYIVGCALLPFTPNGNDMWYPKIGLFAFQYAYPIVSEQFVEIDCGTIDINEYWGSCFDYEPYCQITIWLPYIGYRALPVDEIMGRTLYVKYHIDCLTGDCVAFVGVTASSDDVTKVIAQYSGNCAVQMPFGSVTFDNMISAGLQMSAGAGVYAASGGNGGGDTLGNATISMISGMKGEVQQGGVMGCTNGYMSIQKPYIIKRIRHQSLPTNYREMRGYPSNVNATLSQLETGYAEVDDIQLNNIPAMEVERKEIIELLKGGVLL